MKKKVLMLVFATLLISGFSNLSIRSDEVAAMSEQGTTQDSPVATPSVTPAPGVTPSVTPMPDTNPSVTPTPAVTVTPTPVPTPQAIAISIKQSPAKIIYEAGETLDLTGMLVEAAYIDGTSAYITDYQITGYNTNAIGIQTIYINYQNQTAALNITVLPKKVTNIKASYHDTSTITLTWDANPNASKYEVYILDELTNTYNLYSSETTNSITLNYPAATIKSFQICAVGSSLGVEYKSIMSNTYSAATNPELVANLAVSDSSDKYISLQWDEVTGATGYLVYRSPAAKNSYELIGTVNTTIYSDTKVSSGTSYKYKVCAFVLDQNYQGEFSPLVDISTNPAMMVLKFKAGEEKVRLKWAKVTGATAYDIYMLDEEGSATLLETVKGNGSVSLIVEDLEADGYYEFYAVSRRYYNGKTYFGQESDYASVWLEPLQSTSTVGKLYLTDEAVKKSWTYQKLPFFSTYVNLDKSFVIPGLTTTNVGGFSSTMMCPQAVTFAGNYLLTTAYDRAGEENSVIYVMNKGTRELITTLVLPGKPHLGGITFDGTYVWATSGTVVYSIAFSDVEAAVAAGGAYSFIQYASSCKLDIATSYLTYYDGKLWVGSYNELKNTTMNSYIIDDFDNKPTLTKVDTVAMPTRVQGVAFTKQGTLILSRSCQLYKGLRGYMRQMDVYKPDFTKKVNGVVQLGYLVNSVSMPSMNEGIAIDGDYLYVTFESGAFDKSTYKMDRICAFKLSDIVKNKTSK